jgi:Rrf2 family nitric oxide-sensitive transcriptional repressor
MYLAVNDDRLSTISEVAKKFGISKNHLMKVSQALSSLGVIESARGRAGGLRLARPPGEISLGPIARALEVSSALVECFPSGLGDCQITPACRLKNVLAEAQEAFFQVLDKQSVEDLVRRNLGLRKLLLASAA